MSHRSFTFPMPAPAEVVFDAFHYHQWRHRWDSLVSATAVEGGAPCPHVGAVTQNAGGGWMRTLSMRTQFVAYDRPRLAAASMVGKSFPFKRWAASMRHKDLGNGQSVLLYTYTFEVGPPCVAWIIRPFVERVFDYQTRKRFERLRTYLSNHAQEIMRWQQEQ